MVAIYGLIDPRTGELRYIGKANNPAKRFATHIRDSARRDTPVYAWFRKLVSIGLQPEMIVLSECDNWQSEEQRLIAAARVRGYPLLNVADGGDEPHCPKEVRIANGYKAARARERDVVKQTIHRFMRKAGEVLKHFTATGDSERANKLGVAVAVLKRRAKQDPVLLYSQIMARKAKV